MCLADAQPSEIERQTYEQVADVFSEAEAILKVLRGYKGATDIIKKAIEHPALQEEAWNKVGA